MWILNRAGKIPFVISGQGHEGAQVGIAYGMRKGLDWMVPYYRSVASLITFGMTPREIMLAQFAKAVRPQLRRPPDARPLRRRRAQHPVALSRRLRPRCCTRPGSRWAAKVRGTGQVAVTLHRRGLAATRATSTRP